MDIVLQGNSALNQLDANDGCTVGLASQQIGHADSRDDETVVLGISVKPSCTVIALAGIIDALCIETASGT